MQSQRGGRDRGLVAVELALDGLLRVRELDPEHVLLLVLLLVEVTCGSGRPPGTGRLPLSPVLAKSWLSLPKLARFSKL